jgi:hypothetical protein
VLSLFEKVLWDVDRLTLIYSSKENRRQYIRDFLRSRSKDNTENSLDMQMLARKKKTHYEVFDKIYFEDRNDNIYESAMAPKADELIKRLK